MTALSEYRARVERDYTSRKATEHTYRPALQRFLESLQVNVVASNEPKREACGAPDFAVTRTTVHGPMTLGYIETKHIGVALADVEKTEQIERYLQALNNFILTDYLDFRWYLSGELHRSARLGRTTQRRQLVFDPAGAEEVMNLLRDFLAHRAAPIRHPEELAQRLARLTHLVRDLIANAFTIDAASTLLKDLKTAFAEVLLPELSVAEFSDMLAQTIAYGLFAARANHTLTSPFRRQDAAREIPKTNPFLRRLFTAISGPELDDEPFVGIVDDLAQLLGDADMEAILADFGTRNDPVVDFYETFLAAYDPKARERRGVYYTPRSVVSYIVRAVDRVLRSQFGLIDGVGDTQEIKHVREDGSEERLPRVLLLDPALGSGTFLYALISLVRDEFRRQNNAGKWSGYVHDHLLPRVFGFELLMAPYAVAHLKLGLQLAALDMPSNERRDWAYEPRPDERLGIYLTNSLEQAAHKSHLLFGEYISEEANAAAEIKRDRPIMVVLGNPPYSGHSANKGKWITDLVADYKRGVPGLDKPAQAKWLQDDYVKFIRFGQWRIDRTGEGVLAYVTNHAYLDNPTFRGMRSQLLSSFGDIYILNLHGSTKRRERAPGGGPDQNVFDIQQGVAIGIFIKRSGTSTGGKLHFADLWGTRDQKYEWLLREDLATTPWTTFDPRPPLYLFVPEDAPLRVEYEQGWSIADIMSENGDPAPGIVTTHDEFAISWSRDEAEAKVKRFLATRSEGEARQLWRLCSQAQWNYDRAKKELASGGWLKEIKPILYRPFDVRWTVFNPNIAVHRRERVMRHMLDGKNLGLVTTRTVEVGRGFEHILCTRYLIQHHSVSIKEVNFLFPLYVHPSEDEISSGLYKRSDIRPNVSPRFTREIESRFGWSFINSGRGDLQSTFGPEDVFAYCYAVLHSPSYREHYRELLRRDFPRIPLTDESTLFRTLVARGHELVGLHLLESPPVKRALTRYPVPGPNLVESGYPIYLPSGAPSPDGTGAVASGRIYISKHDSKRGKRGQYFEGIVPEVWAFEIGGTRVCEKWLKDRQGRALSGTDIAHFEEIVVAIAETLRLMREIDAAITRWPML